MRRERWIPVGWMDVWMDLASLVSLGIAVVRKVSYMEWTYRIAQLKYLCFFTQKSVFIGYLQLSDGFFLVIEALLMGSEDKSSWLNYTPAVNMYDCF